MFRGGTAASSDIAAGQVLVLATEGQRTGPIQLVPLGPADIVVSLLEAGGAATAFGIAFVR